MAKSTSKAWDMGRSVTDSPYVKRLIEDDELRENIVSALNSAKNAYGRVAEGRKPAKRLMDDRRVHRDLRRAAESLRDASTQLRGKRTKKAPWGKLVLVGLLGVVLALVLNEEWRNAVLDKILGPEEEFEFASASNGTADAEVDDE